MACLGLRSSGGIANRDLIFGNRVKPTGHPLNRVSLPRCSAASPTAARMEIPAARGGGGGRAGISGPEKLDRWIKESVVDIVQNLREAPLFVHVYGGGGGPETRLKTEKAVAEEWAHLKGKWVKGEEPSPEGIILVEELKEDEMEIIEEDEGQNGESTKAWGVLIQGKGDDGGVACYLLKTSRVGGSNLGLFCTHYCLTKVKSFRESARSQLTNCWLV